MALDGLAPGLRTFWSITIAPRPTTPAPICVKPILTPGPSQIVPRLGSIWLEYLQHKVANSTCFAHRLPTSILGSETCFYSPFSFRATNRIRMAIVLTARCHLSCGAAAFITHTNNKSILRESTSPVQSAPLCSPTHPHPPVQARGDHTQAQASTGGSRLRETIPYPCWIVFIPYRYRTSSHLEPGQPSVHQCASVSRLPSSLVIDSVRPARSASLPSSLCTLSTSSAVSSRLVPCHRPRCSAI